MHHELIVDIALTPVKNPTAKIVLLAMASYCNGAGECFPSQQKLAEDTFLTDRTVRSAIRWLVEHGYLEVKARPNSSNLYILTAMKETDMDHEEKFSSEVVSNITRLDIAKRSIANTTITSAEKFAHPHDTPFFLAFWQAYPRRVAKGAARTAFAKAAKFANPNDIIQGAIAFAAHCEERGVEKQYIPHASTWLNAERWEDDLEAEKTEFKQENKHGWLSEL